MRREHWTRSALKTKLTPMLIAFAHFVPLYAQTMFCTRDPAFAMRARLVIPFFFGWAQILKTLSASQWAVSLTTRPTIVAVQLSVNVTCVQLLCTVVNVQCQVTARPSSILAHNCHDISA